MIQPKSFGVVILLARAEDLKVKTGYEREVGRYKKTDRWIDRYKKRRRRRREKCQD